MGSQSLDQLEIATLIEMAQSAAKKPNNRAGSRPNDANVECRTTAEHVEETCNLGNREPQSWTELIGSTDWFPEYVWYHTMVVNLAIRLVYPQEAILCSQTTH